MLPAFVRVGGERDIYKGSPLRALGFSGECHVGLVGKAIALASVARDARANDIFPGRLTAPVARHHMVEVERLSRKNAVAVLAGVFIPLKNIVACEFHFLFRKALKKEQHDNARHSDLHRNRLSHLIIRIAARKISPACEVMSDESLPCIRIHDLGVTLVEEGEGTSGAAGVYRLPEPVEN